MTKANRSTASSRQHPYTHRSKTSKSFTAYPVTPTSSKNHSSHRNQHDPQSVHRSIPTPQTTSSKSSFLVERSFKVTHKPCKIDIFQHLKLSDDFNGVLTFSNSITHANYAFYRPDAQSSPVFLPSLSRILYGPASSL